MDVIKTIEDKYLKDAGTFPDFRVGDTLSVSTIISREGKGKRTQVFTGLLIAINGAGVNKTITLRRISYGEGVEKVFPLHGPNLTTIKVEQKGLVRRSKLYYLRQRIGKKATKVKQRKTK